MAQITAAMIKELRERTGVGMGKCKEALEEAKGDLELAIANLRKAGEASAVKKAGRETKEGTIAVSEDDKAVALAEVNAETDFVVKNDLFQKFLHHVIYEVLAKKPASLEAFLQETFSKDPNLTMDQYRAVMVQTIGENIQVKRIKIIPKSKDKTIGVYSHLGGKIVVIVEISGSDQEQELAKNIAMHIAAASPDYLSPEAVPQDVIANERDIAKSQIQGKPDNIVEKIVDGKIKAFYDAACLTCQKYIRDDAKTIDEVVKERAKAAGKPLTLTSFIRWQVGA